MTDLDNAVRHLLAGYPAAVLARDVDAFAALYDVDVRVFDLWGRWSYDGIDAWRAMAEEWFGSLGDERVAVVFDDLRVTASGDLAVAHAFVTYRAESADGVELRALHNRITWSLRRVRDLWKIVHEHSSAPVDFETAKVMLKR